MGPALRDSPLPKNAAEHALDAPIRAAMELSARKDNVDAIANMEWWTRRFRS